MRDNRSSEFIIGCVGKGRGTRQRKSGADAGVRGGVCSLTIFIY